MNQDQKVTRRVYHRELQERTGWGPSWIRELEKAGKIPPGRVDEGGKRKWWTDVEADAIVSGQHAIAKVQTV